MELFSVLAVLYLALIYCPSPAFPEPSDSDSTVPTDVLVSINTGQLRGVRYFLTDGQTMNEFRGVPYARPPTGDLRFAPPRPALRWSGVRDATRYGNHCPQEERRGFLNGQTTMNEDCLYLDVYSPLPLSGRSLSSSPLIPVMVWIHGGAYSMGSGSFYDGSLLAAQGQVIVVTFNYRLAVLGFLSTEDDVIPGNFGMLDQVMALKWIRLNNRQFGGDPDRVTIFGGSAGANSCSLLSLSPLTSGLFRRAIMLSGSSFAPTTLWRSSDATSPKDAATQIAAKVGCLQQDSQQLLICLRSKSWEEIQAANPAFFAQTEENGFVLWKPRVDGESGFLPEEPTALFSKGKFADVETMHGFCANEMGILIHDEENNGFTLTEFKDRIALVLAPYSLDNKDELIQQISLTFLPKDATPIQRRAKLIEIWSDFHVSASIIHEIDVLVNAFTSPVPIIFSKKHFLYRFSYRGSLLPYSPAWQGVSHGVSIPFVFGLPPTASQLFLVDHEPTPTDYKVAQLVVQLWSNFAKYGDPTPQSPVQIGISWPEYGPDQRLILDISENAKVQVLNWEQQYDAFQLMIYPIL